MKKENFEPIENFFQQGIRVTRIKEKGYSTFYFKKDDLLEEKRCYSFQDLSSATQQGWIVDNFYDLGFRMAEACFKTLENINKDL